MLQLLTRNIFKLKGKEITLLRYQTIWLYKYTSHNLKQNPCKCCFQLKKNPTFRRPSNNFVRGFKEGGTISSQCWKCGKTIENKVEQFMCYCGVLQAPDPNRNYFQVMGMEKNFDIDAKMLSENLKDLQKILHPDKFGQKSEEEKQFSEQHSAIVNKAFDTLTKPLSRGLYLLSLYGENIEEGHVEMDQGFLMDIMDINERLAEVASLRDLEEFEKSNEAKREELVLELRHAFEGENIKQAKSILMMLQYFANIEEKIKDIRLTLL